MFEKNVVGCADVIFIITIRAELFLHTTFGEQIIHLKFKLNVYLLK